MDEMDEDDKYLFEHSTFEVRVFLLLVSMFSVGVFCYVFV